MPDGTPSPIPPAPPAAPPAVPPAGQPPAPVPTLPATQPPAVPPAGGQPSEGQPPANGGEKTFTQAQVDQILSERLNREREAQNKRFAEALGIKDPDAPTDPAQAIAASQAETQKAKDIAVAAVAEALALKAGIKPERVDTFVTVAQQSGLFKNVDLAAPEAKTALAAALAAKAGEFPEWKAGPALPPASGGDLNQPGNGKPMYTKDRLAKMSADELAEHADDILAAYQENRIL